MADPAVPHFCNDAGVETVHIGVSEFKCMGTSPPHDHPHIYLDMGDDARIVCPYCSTVYERDPSLNAVDTSPPGCLYQGNAAA